MCGFAGFFGTGGRDDLVAMTRALAHRGPDEEGFHVDADHPVFLGHQRLSILDIEGGRQPMYAADGQACIVFGGEIYNHAELRRELEAKGHVFQSDHSDTETLIRGYLEWGEDLPGRLNGMFAFAILDRPRRRLFLARDRFGEKPLYYFHRKGSFAFASELSALRLHPACPAELDQRALQKLFGYGYIPAPHTMLAGCRKLPGGTALTFDFAAGTLRLNRYWQFRLQTDEAMGSDEGLLVEELRALLQQAVRRRLISDVPLGIFLSGGLDSSTVLAAATGGRRGPALKTFTIGFSEPSFDESGHAREVAEHFRSEHHEEILDLGKAQGSMGDILARLDEPLGDPSLLPTLWLSRFSRQHVTVALSGDGGDELFAGYDPFRALAPAMLYDRLVPRGLHGSVRRLADLLPRSDRNMSFDFRLRRLLRGLSHQAGLWNPVWMSPLDESELRDLFEAPLRPEELYEEALTLWENSGSASPVDRSLEFYTNLYLQDDILAKSDRASMMVSLEARAVFLDNDLVAFCQRLPHRFKYRNGKGKYLLRKALEGMVPDTVLKRPKKGFGIPVSAWLRDAPKRVPMQAIPGLRMNVARQYWDAHRQRQGDFRLFLWNWLSLQAALGEQF